MRREQRRQKLVVLLRNPTREMRRRLSSLKREGKERFALDDFIWHALLLSFSTWGNSRGRAGLIDNRCNYRRVTFPVLMRMSESKRRAHIERILRDAKVNRPLRKAELLNRNVTILQNMGGLKGAKSRALAQKGTDAKIRFMKQFYGIGDKYARNIWMDAYDSDFHQSIAVDARIKSLSNALGYHFDSYAGEEEFYRQIAEDAAREPWEVDRLVYNFKDELMEGIGHRRICNSSSGCRVAGLSKSRDNVPPATQTVRRRSQVCRVGSQPTR